MDKTLRRLLLAHNRLGVPRTQRYLGRPRRAYQSTSAQGEPELTFEDWHRASRKDRIELIMKASGWSSTVPGEVELEVIQSGCEGTTGPALALATSTGVSYLINAPESVERNLHNARVKLSSLRHVLCTRSCWGANGGLAGLVLSLNAAGGPQATLALHGPPQLKRLFDITRPFYDERNVRLQITECPYTSRVWENDAVHLHYLPILNSQPQEKQTIATPLQDDLQNKEIRGSLREALSSLSSEDKRPSELSVAFLISLKPRPGRMNLLRCKELGVPVGPLLGRLQNGHSVTLEDGSVVTPDMVLEVLLLSASTYFLSH